MISDPKQTYWLYLMACGQRKVYVGVSSDPLRRLREHRRQQSANTKMNRPHDLIAAVEVGPLKDAYAMERRVKRLPHHAKLSLAASLRQDPSWKVLVDRFIKQCPIIERSVLDKYVPDEGAEQSELA